MIAVGRILRDGAAVLALAAIAACGDGGDGGDAPPGSTTADVGDGSIPSANFDLEKVIGRSVGDSTSVSDGTRVGADALGVELPVPPPLADGELVRTADGLLAHARGARLHRASGVIEGDQVRFSARLRNISGRALRLTRVEGECKCIDARGYLLEGARRVGELWAGDDVPAGAEFEVLVHLDTTDRTGELQLEGILDYRGAAAPLKFAIATDIAAIYTFRPALGLQAGVVLGQPHETMIRVGSQVAERFKLEADTGNLPRHVALEFRAVKPNAAGYAREWIGTYRISANAPDRALLRTHEVQLTVTAEPTADEPVPVSYLRSVDVGYRTSLPVEFVQRIEAPNGRKRLVSGSAVAFGVMEPGALDERRVTLAIRDDWEPVEGDLEVELRDVVRVSTERLPEGALTARWEAGRQLVLRLENADDGIAGPMNAQFVVRLGHPDVPTLLVNVSALLR